MTDYETDALLAEIARLRAELRGVRDELAQRDRALEAAHRKIDMLRADDATLRDGIRRYAEATPEERGPLYHRLFVLTIADGPGAAYTAELDAARAVVAAARTGFGTEEDIQRAYAFDPNLLTARIRAYDEATKAREL